MLGDLAVNQKTDEHISRKLAVHFTLKPAAAQELIHAMSEGVGKGR